MRNPPPQLHLGVPLGGRLMDGRSRGLRGKLACHCLLAEIGDPRILIGRLALIGQRGSQDAAASGCAGHSLTLGTAPTAAASRAAVRLG
ncbi:MAG TPA: hypothetical protein VF516_14990, partial [Kofleriaceae bacterium]